MKSYFELVAQIACEALDPRYKKPSKNDDRLKFKDAREVYVEIGGPDRNEKGTLWYVPSQDGPVLPWVLGYAAEKWGTAPWVVHTFRFHTSRVGDGVKFVRHAECVKNGYAHWKKYSASPNSTF